MRTAHKAITIVIAAALTLSVTACGTSSTPPKPKAVATTATPGASTTAKPTPAPTVAEGWVAPTADNPFGIDWANQTPFTGPATDKFGAANVMAAYREMITFSLQEGYSDLMAKGYDARPIEFSFVDPYLTPAAQTFWASTVKSALAKDDKATGSVVSLITWNSTTGQDVYKFRAGQLLYTTGVDFSAAKTSVVTVAGVDYLSIQFTVTRKVRVMKSGKPVLLPLSRDITYQLIPNGLKDIPWLIDNWTATSKWGLDKTTPDPLGVNS